MVFEGASVDDLRTFAGSLSSASSRLLSIRHELVAKARSVHWPGPDGDRYRSDVTLQLSAALQRVSDTLTATHARLVVQADQQEATSAEGAGVAAPQDRNKFWFWQDGFAAFWSDKADLRDDIPLGDEEFTLDNVAQQSFPNCATVSSLAVLGRFDDDYLQSHIKRVGPEKYEITLYGADGKPVVYTVEGDISKHGVRGADGNQSWVSLYEAALQQHGVLTPEGEYADDASGVFQAVTGAKGVRSFPGQEAYPTFDELKGLASQEKPIILGSVKDPVSDAYARSQGVEPLQIVELHAYMVEGVNDNGTVTLVNPWGSQAGYSGDEGAHRITITEKQYQLYFNQAYQAADRSTWK